MMLGEIAFFGGIVSQIEFKDRTNLVLLKIKYFENKSESKEKILEINKDLFEEKLSDLVIDCWCFVGIRRNNIKILEKMKKGFDSSLYDKLSAREWYSYKKEMTDGYHKYFRDDVIFLKVISNENGEEVDDVYLSSGNLDDIEINNFYKVFKRLNNDSIKSVSRKK